MGWFRKTPPPPVGAVDEVTPADAGWRGVDPLGPTVGPMPVTVETSSFEAGLPSRGIPRWVRPLAHGRSAAAPRGLADGIVTMSTAVEGRRAGLLPLDVAPPPPGRDGSGGPSPIADDPGGPASSAPATPVHTPPAAPGPAPGAVGPVAARLPAPTPPPAVPVLDARHASTADPPPMPPAVDRGSGTAAPAAPAPSASSPVGARDTGRAPTGDAPRDAPGLAPPARADDAPILPSMPPHVQGDVPPDVDRPPSVHTEATPRRLGLGAPLRSRPSGSPPVSRLAAQAPDAGPGAAGGPPVVPGPVPDREPAVGAAPSEPGVSALPAMPVVPATPPAGATPPADVSDDAPMLGDQPSHAVGTRPRVDPPQPAVAAAGPLPPPAGGSAHGAAPVVLTAPEPPNPTTTAVVARDIAPLPTATASIPGAAPGATWSVVDPWRAARPVVPYGGPAEVPTLTARPITPVLRSPARSAARSDPGAAAPVTRAGAGATEVPPHHVRAAAEAVTGVALDGVVVHRSPAVSAVAERIGARAFTAGGEAHVPAEAGSLGGGEAAALGAHELVHVAQQRALGASTPLEGTAGGRVLEARAERAATLARLPLAAGPATDAPAIPDPADAALRAGVAQRDVDGSIVFHAPASDPPPEVAVQRAPVAAPALSPAAGGGAEDNDKLDQLAKQLYDKIRDRLKAELRLDRERWGRVTDLSR